MNLTQGLDDLVAVALVAALAPIIVAVLPGPRVPQVVIFLFGGVLIGPHVLGLAETSAIQLLANIGLGFLFLLAGYELDPALLRQRAGRRLGAFGCLSAKEELCYLLIPTRIRCRRGGAAAGAGDWGRGVDGHARWYPERGR